MNDLTCGQNEESLNIQVSVIDQAIVDLQTVVDELSGVDGIQLIKEVGKLVEDNLDGKYKEAIVVATGDRILSYETGIINVMNVVYILKVYREYLKNGPNSKLNENLGHIEMEPKVMYKEVGDLEQSIWITKSRVSENGELDKYISRRQNYLEEEIRRKESKEPPEDASREKYLLSVLTYDASKHQSIRPKIEETMYELLQINQMIEEQVKVLNQEVESYSKLWDGYANQDLKVIEYNNINYSLSDIEQLSKLEEETLTKVATTNDETLGGMKDYGFLDGVASGVYGIGQGINYMFHPDMSEEDGIKFFDLRYNLENYGWDYVLGRAVVNGPAVGFVLEYLAESEITRILSMNKNLNKSIDEINNQSLGKNDKWLGTAGYDELHDANIGDFDLSGKGGKHLEGHSGDWSKFNTSDPKEANKIAQDAVKNGEIKKIDNNNSILSDTGKPSYRAEIETGSTIGTEGETGIRITYDEEGNVWSIFPINIK